MGAGIAAGLRPGGYERFRSTTSPRSGSTRRSRPSTAICRARSPRGSSTKRHATRSSSASATPPTLDKLADCDLVVEAASENEEVKRKIFTALRPFLKPDAIVASNTSSISITRLASVTAEPRAFHRHPFHEPGAADAARRADPRHRDQGRHVRGGQGLRHPARQDRDDVGGLSRPSSSTASCCR